MAPMKELATSAVRVVRGDAKDVVSIVGRGTVELAYLDPPFAVGARFAARTKAKEARGRETKSAGPIAYDDRWPSLLAYLAWLEARIVEVRETLSGTGTLWLHLDQRAVHEAKGACDRVFGPSAFVGEVIWVPGNGSKAAPGPGMSHQTLLLYARGRDFVWNSKEPALRAPFARTSLSMHFRSRDEEGREY